MSDTSCIPRRVPVWVQRLLAGAVFVAAPMVGSDMAFGAEQPLPFEGTWVRSDRVCTAAAPSARTYAGRMLISPSGRCTLRKVAFGAGEFELFEDCRRTERAGNVVEKIRMLGPDALILKYQVNRLKIPRGRRYMRCTSAAPKPVPPSPGRLPPSSPSKAAVPSPISRDPE